MTLSDIYMLIVIGRTPGGSDTVHIYTKTIQNTQNIIYIKKNT
jgi:hypothetical protein